MASRSGLRRIAGLTMVAIGSAGEIAILILRYIAARQPLHPGTVIPVSPPPVGYTYTPPAPEFYLLSIYLFIIMLAGIVVTITTGSPRRIWR